MIWLRSLQCQRDYKAINLTPSINDPRITSTLIFFLFQRIWLLYISVLIYRLHTQVFYYSIIKTWKKNIPSTYNHPWYRTSASWWFAGLLFQHKLSSVPSISNRQTIIHVNTNAITSEARHKHTHPHSLTRLMSVSYCSAEPEVAVTMPPLRKMPCSSSSFLMLRTWESNVWRSLNWRYFSFEPQINSSSFLTCLLTNGVCWIIRYCRMAGQMGIKRPLLNLNTQRLNTHSDMETWPSSPYVLAKNSVPSFNPFCYYNNLYSPRKAFQKILLKCLHLTKTKTLHNIYIMHNGTAIVTQVCITIMLQYTKIF